MILEILLDGRPLAAGLQASLLNPDLAAVEPAIYSVILNRRSYEVRVVSSGDDFIVEVRGRHFRVELRDPRNAGKRARGGMTEGPQHLSASMPGKIVRLLVKEGDRVTPGQGLLVVEAMKMQNEVKSPKEGRVVQLLALEGATVSAGDVLVTID